MVVGCDICEGTRCYTCSPGFVLQADFTCFGSSCISPCSTCTTPTSCTSCVAGYYLTSPTCTICPTTCKTCLDAATCLTCPSQMVLAAGVCSVCAVGLQFNPYTLACQTCSANCMNCSWTAGCYGCVNPMFELTLISNKYMCEDICGDGYLNTLACDLPLGVANDGCADDCTI